MTNGQFYQQDDNQLLNLTNMSLRRSRPLRAVRLTTDTKSSPSPETESNDRSFRLPVEPADRIQRAQLMRSKGSTETSPSKLAAPEPRMVKAGFIDTVNTPELMSIRGPARSPTVGSFVAASSARPTSSRLATSPINSQRSIALFTEVNGRVRKVTYSGEVTLEGLKKLFVEKFSAELENADIEKSKLQIRDSISSVFYELENTFEVVNQSFLRWYSPATAPKDHDIDGTQQAGEPAQKLAVASSDHHGLDEIKQELSILHEAVKLVSQRLDNLSALTPAEAPTKPATKDAAAVAREGEKEKGGEDEEGNTMSTAQAAPASTTNSGQASGDEAAMMLKRELKELKEELCRVRKEKQESEAKLNQQVASIQGELEKARKLLESKPHSHRAKLEEDQEHLKNSYNNLLKQHTDVEALLQDLRLDITKRGSIPSETKMAQTNKDLDSIEHTCQALLAFYNDNCPKWKRTWESELHGIVQEKQFSDDVHQLLRELLEDTAPLRDLFTKLEKIAELKAKERLMKSGSSQPKFLSIVPHEDDDLARQIMLSEIQGIEIDHERRLEALERATKSREKELTNRVDEFEKELGDYVTNQKLRKTGGTEELERRRKKKDEEVLKAMLSSMAEVRLAADIGANPD